VPQIAPRCLDDLEWPQRRIRLREDETVPVVEIPADGAAVQIKLSVMLEAFGCPEHGARPLALGLLIDRPAQPPMNQVAAGPAIEAIARPQGAVEVVEIVVTEDEGIGNEDIEGIAVRVARFLCRRQRGQQQDEDETQAAWHHRARLSRWKR
jgi:hypothetical protein